jgi:hypothetical protein
MIDLKPLIQFLKIVSMLGLIVTCSMMTAVTYKKLKEYYPTQVEDNKWVFVVFAGLSSMLMIFLFQRFF